MKKLLTIGLLLTSLLAAAQSETHNFTTYDTTIIYRYDPFHTTNYYLRISRPVNLFTAGNPDTASRPAIITMNGAGEMNSNPSSLIAYGPHYLLNAGTWDGSVVLGNGIHYPILITMVCAVSPPQPPIAGNFWVMDYMIKHYHIKPNSVHLGGLSEGSFTWAGMIGITDTTGTGQTGVDIGMREVTSMTLLSGAATSSGNFTEFGHWAKKYGGRAFLTVGYNDAQTINPPQLAQKMNDSVPQSAYFTYNTIAGGGHGGWNTDYDPTVVLWNSGVAPYTPAGTYVTTSTQPNSQGTYRSTSSIFQWMLRQGDTSLVGTRQTTIAKVGVAEYFVGYLGSDGNVYAYYNGSTTPISLPLPGSRLAAQIYGGFNNFKVIATDGTKWVSSNYNTGSPTVTWRQSVTDTLGNAITNATNIWAWADAAVMLRADGTGWLDENDSIGIIHALGTQYLITKPVQFTQTGVSYQKFQAGFVGIVGLTTDGRVFLWKRGQNSKTPVQITSARKILDIATAGYNSILGVMQSATGDTTKGTIVAYGDAWGTWGASTAASYSSFTDISVLWPGTWAQVNMSTQATTAITAAGQMYAAGYNPQGEIGNGQETVNKYYYPTFPGYGWSFANFENPVAPPQPITSSGTVFTQMWTNPFFAFFKYAQDASGNIYSWGRNKSNVLGNGILLNPLDSTNQFHPNSFDIQLPKIVTPLGQTVKTVTFKAPAISAGARQVVSGNTATLTASGRSMALTNVALSTDTVCCAVAGWSWQQVSGPSASTIVSPSSISTVINNLVTGTYYFLVTETDVNTGQDTAGVQIVVSSTTLPSVSPGPNQFLTLPTSFAVVYGTCTGNGGATIVSSSYAQTGGPITVALANSGTPTVPIMSTSGMTTVGTYTFRLTALDSNGNTNGANVTITVSLPPTPGGYLTFPVITHVKVGP